MKDVIYDDVINGLLFLETGIILYRKEYIVNRNAIYFGRYNIMVDGSGIIYDNDTRQRLGFFKYNIPYFTRIGLLKLGNMDIHIDGKAEFESKIINYLISNKIEDIGINLDGGLDGLNIFFLKYIKDEDVLNRILWSINRHKHVVLKLKLYHNKIIYTKGNPDEFIRCYSTNDFLKKYETMGLELAPCNEETKPLEFPQSVPDSFKDKSLSRGKPTTNEFVVKPYIHPKAFKRTDKIEPFRRPTGGARCIMTKIDGGLVEEIKNLDAEELYPKTTTINNLSIHDDKIIEAYEQFLNMISDKEKYDGISIRVPKECEDDWFEILPCFKYVRNLAYKITPELDLYVNIRKLDNNSGNYVIDISGTDYTTANINNNRLQFSESDKVLTIDIYNLQTRLVDIIQDIKSPIVGQGDEVKLGNKISSELKDTGSRTQIRYDNDGTSGATLMRCYNNLLRGLPFDHIDNFDFEGDNIEMLFSQSSINKRLPDSNWSDKLTGEEVLDVSELKLLEDTYNKYINTVSIRIEDDVIKLNTYYKQLFGIHISIGVLESDLKLKYEYGYRLDGNKCLAYGILSATVVPFSYMLSKKPMNIHKDINNKYSVFKANESNMFTTIDGIKGLDSNQSEKCNIIYKSIFNKYIELGILRDELNLKQTDSTNVCQFVDVDELYADDYITQFKPERLYNIFEILVDNINHSKLDLYNRLLLIDIKYKTMFNRYILDGLMYPNVMLNNHNINGMLTIPKLNMLWLHR